MPERSESSSPEAPEVASISAEEALADLRVAVISRELDEVEKRWQKVGKAKFCILGAGQEIAQLCAARPLRPGDWLRSYYRGITEALAAETVTPQEALAQVLGDSERGHDPSSGGRMMGRHFGSRVLKDNGELIDLLAQVNHASDDSPTASQMGPALGLAVASKVFRAHPEIGERYPHLTAGGREVVHVCIGDAALAEGIALEAINQAVVQQAPLVISVYDNGYGISVPGDKQMAHASASKALAGFAAEEGGDGLLIVGPLQDWDYPGLKAGYERAYRWVRERRQPALVHVEVTQLEGHSSSGDQRRYKSPERLEWELAHDGIEALKRWILSEGLASEGQLEELCESARREVQEAAEAAWEAYYRPLIGLSAKACDLFRAAKDLPEGLTALERHKAHVSDNNLFVQALALEEDQDLKTRSFLTRGRILLFLRELLAVLREAAPEAEVTGRVRDLCRDIAADGRRRYNEQCYAEPAQSPCHAPKVAPRYAADAPEDTGAHIIAAGFATLMAADPRIVAYGEDVGALGGVTTCTLGLQGGEAQVEPSIWKKSPALLRYIPKEGFGASRVWDTGIAEGTIVGAAAGMAIRGLLPIAEIQYQDYVNYGAQQLEDEVACLRHRTRGGQSAPCIVRCHGHRLLGMWHSGSPMAMMLRMPGLRVITPRDAVQAVALYRAAIVHGYDPVFSVEPLLDLYGKLKVPENLDEVCLPFGHSEVLREGDEVSIVTYGHCCSLALQAAEQLEAMGISAEVVDLQTLNPLDLNDVAARSIRKTGKVVFLDEDTPNGAMGMISKSLIFDRKDEEGRPNLWFVDGVEVLTSPDHKPAYGADGGFFSKPQVFQIVERACGLLDSLDGGKRRLQ